MSQVISSSREILLRGGSWTIGAQGIRFVAQITTMSLMARLLVPSDFGAVAMLASVFALLELIRDLGFNASIVQRPEISQAQLVRIFRISLVAGLLVTCVAAALGGLVSWFARDPNITAITPVLGLTFLGNSLSTVPMGLLRRRLQFRLIAIRDLGSYLFGAIMGVLVAFAGGGIWSLVAMAVTSSVSNLILVWISAAWLPVGPAASWRELHQFLKLGGAFTIGEFANYITSNLDNILIGRAWGMLSLGFYTRGYALMLAPISQIMGPMGAVIQPLMCRIQGDEIRMNRLIKRLSILFGVLGSMLAVFVLVSASALIPMVLGPGWEQTITIVQWLSLGVFVRPLAGLLYWTVVAKGKSQLFVKWTVLNCVINVAAILVGLPHGATEVAMTLGIAAVALILPNAIVLAASATGLKTTYWLFLYFRTCLVLGMAALVAWLLGLLDSPTTTLADHLLQVSAAAGLSIASGALVLFSYRESKSMICELMRKAPAPN